MGKEWSWTARSSSSSKRGGADAEEEPPQPPSGCMCAVFHFFDFHPFHFPTTINQHHQHTPLKSQNSCITQDHSQVPKGAEAPRNSLESEDGNGRVSSLSKEEFEIPKNIIQIKTSGSTRTSGGNLNDLSSEISTSPGTKTPTLVARLMGLDLLPGAHSPSFSSSSSLSTPNPQGNNTNVVPHLHHLRHKQHNQTRPRNSIDSSDIAATRSLPETPRTSLARRSDVDNYHHRLSLQITKENMNLCEDHLELPRFSFSKRKCDENNVKSSSSHYAKQIVKQVKESVSRKVGQDITNTPKRREEILGQFIKSSGNKKCAKTSLRTIDETNPGKHSNPSSNSPRLRFIDTKHKPNTTTSSLSPLIPKDQNMLKLPPPPPQLPKILTKPKAQALLPHNKHQENNKTIVATKCKKVNNDKFNSSRLKRPPQKSDIIRNKQEESFIIRPTSTSVKVSDIKSTKCKKTHPILSSNLLTVKIDPSPPATKIPSKQVSDTYHQESKSSSSQLSSCSRQRYKQEGTTTLATQETTTNTVINGASTTGKSQHHYTPEFQYITAIITPSTFTKNTEQEATALSFNHQWHPLDPSMFHHLEHSNNDKDRNFPTKNQLGHRWNRRLLFDLVDEVLGEILRPPKGNPKRLWFTEGIFWKQYHEGKNIEGLIEMVWKRVEEFPCAKCEVLEDIDGLVESERIERVNEMMEEEGEGLVAAIEGNIWDTLVHETVMVMDCSSTS
ncbi:hypothetical protein RJT34_26251 [Clitoria ternatea]|uniref:DUF4378 domain-containing protein n=1 Tax=Clitoria ternatea TaxID=43366 RepID=A0AAN9FB62_CLITE